MKQIFTRMSFIAFALSLGLGIPGQARAANGGCDGRNVIHRKTHGKDLAGYMAGAIGRISGYDKVSTCVPFKPFIPPAIRTADVRMPNLPEPPEASLPRVATSMVSVSGTTVPVIAKTPAKQAAPVAAVKPAGTIQRTPAKRRTYRVMLNIPSETAKANGIVPGMFPANYLENQKKGGEWGSRMKTVARVSETPGGYQAELFLRHAPAKNSAVAVDFENGNSIEVARDLLIKGEMTQTVIPPLPKKKRYNALMAAYRVRTPLMLSLVRIAAPTAPQAILGGFTMGTSAAAMPAINLLQGIVMRKLIGNQRALAAAEHPSLNVDYLLTDQHEKLEVQDAHIKALEFQIESLRKQMADLLRQTKTTAAPTAKR